jgi:hypothetical protein
MWQASDILAKRKIKSFMSKHEITERGQVTLM